MRVTTSANFKSCLLNVREHLGFLEKDIFLIFSQAFMYLSSRFPLCPIQEKINGICSLLQLKFPETVSNLLRV